MKNNPFASQVFIKVWLKYFKPNKPIFSFQSIKKVQFYKSKYLPLFVNIGKNITNGMHYELDDEVLDYKGKTFLIYDVPEYLDQNIGKYSKGQKIRIKKVRQYNGFLLDLKSHGTYNDLMSSLKSKKRRNLIKKQDHLESTFNISYHFYYGSLEIEFYQKMIKNLKILISKRFSELGIDNDILTDWDYYKELIFSMINEKKAMLFSINDGNRPIAMAFCFLSKEILFYAIPTFDTDYIKYNLGHTSIIELLKWCFKNDIKLLDFSKGEYEYKKRWSNMEYDFKHHIVYDSSSLKAALLANSLYLKYSFIQFLRDNKVNLLRSKIKFYFKRLRNH